MNIFPDKNKKYSVRLTRDMFIVVDEIRNIIRYKKILLIGGIHYAVFRLFFIFTNVTTASTALIKHQNDQIYKSP